jgi:hypothetical protein
MRNVEGDDMKLLTTFVVLATAALVLNPAQASSWKCSAKGIVSGSYSGGSKAYIHLRPYTSGGQYSVKKVNANKVTGKTKNGTPFTCSK